MFPLSQNSRESLLGCFVAGLADVYAG